MRLRSRAKRPQLLQVAFIETRIPVDEVQDWGAFMDAVDRVRDATWHMHSEVIFGYKTVEVGKL